MEISIINQIISPIQNILAQILNKPEPPEANSLVPVGPKPKGGSEHEYNRFRWEDQRLLLPRDRKSWKWFGG